MRLLANTYTASLSCRMKPERFQLRKPGQETLTKKGGKNDRRGQ